MTEQEKKSIDDMSYESMFSQWRFAPIGSPMFQGERGEYFSKVMKEKRSRLAEGEHSRISKQIGW